VGQKRCDPMSEYACLRAERSSDSRRAWLRAATPAGQALWCRGRECRAQTQSTHAGYLGAGYSRCHSSSARRRPETLGCGKCQAGRDATKAQWFDHADYRRTDRSAPRSRWRQPSQAPQKRLRFRHCLSRPGRLAHGQATGPRTCGL